MKGTPYSNHFILHPSAFILTMTPSPAVGLPPHRTSSENRSTDSSSNGTKMATIVFMPFHWASDLNPTFALARKLRDRGHRVHFLCIPDTEARVRAQGFEFTPVF